MKDQVKIYYEFNKILKFIIIIYIKIKINSIIFNIIY